MYFGKFNNLVFDILVMTRDDRAVSEIMDRHYRITERCYKYNISPIDCVREIEVAEAEYQENVH